MGHCHGVQGGIRLDALEWCGYLPNKEVINNMTRERQDSTSPIVNYCATYRFLMLSRDRP